jgi:hypothetical protein
MIFILRFDSGKCTAADKCGHGRENISTGGNFI